MSLIFHKPLEILVVCLLFPFMAGAQSSNQQKSQPAPSPRYLILETTKVSTMQKELGDAAHAGYRVVAGIGRTILILERVAEPRGNYEYLLVEAIQQPINEAGAKGFRVPPALVSDKIEGLLMEKAPDSNGQYQYLLLRLPSLQTELTEAGHQGYAVIGMTSELGYLDGYVLNPVVLMEKRSEAPNESAAPATEAEAHSGQDYLVLSGEGRLSLANAGNPFYARLNASVAEGYRVLDGPDSEVVLILQKPARVEAPVQSNVLFATRGAEPMEKILNEAGAKGFRLLPRTFGSLEHNGFPHGFLASSGRALYGVVEKHPDSNARYQYLVLATSRISTMQKELNQAADKGFGVAVMVLSEWTTRSDLPDFEYVVVLAKTVTE